MERRNTQGSSKDFELYTVKIRGVSHVFQKMCFHKAHEDQWKQWMDNNDDNE